MKIFLILLFAALLGSSAIGQTNPQAAATKYFEGTLTLNGSSQTLFLASESRNVITIYNPVANASVWLNLSGGTAVADKGMMIPAGITVIITGPFVPKTAVTIIGTNLQVVSTMEGR